MQRALSRAAMLLQINRDLVSINQKLAEYRAAWDDHVDAWLVVRVGSPEWVHRVAPAG